LLLLHHLEAKKLTPLPCRSLGRKLKMVSRKHNVAALWFLMVIFAANFNIQVFEKVLESGKGS
jgi:hypothetical protein